MQNVEVADAWVSSQEPALFQAGFAPEQVNFGLLSMFIFVLFGLTFIIYGLEVTLTDVYPKWLGCAGLVVGIAVALIGLVQAYNGPSDLVTTILFTVWVMVVGALMWRRAGATP